MLTFYIASSFVARHARHAVLQPRTTSCLEISATSVFPIREHVLLSANLNPQTGQHLTADNDRYHFRTRLSQ